MRMIVPSLNSRGFTSFFDEMERATTGYDERTFNPACDVIETEEKFLMSLDVPGIKKEDIKIELNGDTVIISGERKRETTNEKVQRFEKSYGFFKRAFTLPKSVSFDQVEAKYENGVLELTLPKTPEAKPRTIQIQ